MSRKQIGILTLYLNDNKVIEELKIYQEMSRIAAKMGLDIIVFTPEDENKQHTQVLAYIYDTTAKLWRRKWMPIPIYVFDRCRFQQSSRMQALKAFKERHPEINFFNRPLGNKWSLHKKIEEHHQLVNYLPETILYTGTSSISRMLKKYPLIYIKPINGTGGRGIIRIQKKGSGHVAISGRDSNRKIIHEQTVKINQLTKSLMKWKLNQIKYIVQQGIMLTLPNGRVHDYRVLVQKNSIGEWEISGVAGRVGALHSVTANLHGGGSALPMDELLRHFINNRSNIETIKVELSNMCIMLCSYLEQLTGSLYELAIDIAIDKDGRIWIIEINPKPAREVFKQIGDKQTYVTAIKRPLEYALYKLQISV